MAGLSLGVNGGFKPRASTKIAQPKAVRSVPDKALAAGLLESEPVLWAELEPIGDFSDPWVGVAGVLGLSTEAWDEPVEGLVGAPEPEVEVDVPEPVRAVSRPPDVLLELDPASPESLALELPAPEPARPFPPALELGVPGLGFAKPPPAALEPEAPVVVGLVSVPVVVPVLLGRFEGVLKPLPELELGVVAA